MAPYASKRKSSGTRDVKKRHTSKGVVVNPAAGSASRRNQSIASRSKFITPFYRQSHLSTYPKTHRTTLSWLAFTNATTTSNTFTDRLHVQLNNAYDPDAALGGTSAIGYATLIAAFRTCFVTHARVKVTFLNQLSGGTINPLLVGITLNTTSANLPSASGAVGEGFSKWGMLGNNPDKMTLEMTVDMEKFFSVPDLLSNYNYASLVSTNTPQICVAHIWDQSDALIGASWVYTVECQMDCTFTDPIGIAT